MKFDELDRTMRVYETIQDHCFLPDIYIVARIDGRCFTSLTKKKHSFERPFDNTFREYMVETTKHLMECGFHVIYGYTQSDEISLLFAFDEKIFGRKARKYNSILAGEASGKFSVLIGEPVSFDCRISELPTKEHVIDYFRWRNEDAARNALNAYCYWTMRAKGESVEKATDYFKKMSVAEKNEFLFQNGINFNDIPLWQKRGIGFYYDMCEVEACNPLTKEKLLIQRRKIKIDYELPMGKNYSEFIDSIICKEK